MDNKYFFFRLNAAQAVILVGIFEMISILQAFLGLGLVLGFISFDGGEVKPMVLGLVFKKEDAETLIDFQSDFRRGLFLPSILFCGFQTLFPSLLIVGVLKENTLFTLPWVIVSWIRVIFGIFLYIPMYLLTFNIVVLFFYFSYVTLGYAFAIYSLHVVNDFRNQSKKQEFSNPDAEKAAIQFHKF
ncbi:uncharacterized protein LOC132204349 [Neocloeon triangulifer]|uniref:uncharacterized protein LOC132204349 n=1 Tax=Neocloeon triangulifer TaxID=2078957 RepID=UPI00286F1100|nr:uncharacterized protein LOC132204349 [Neocloeon triangulifer]